MAIFQPRPFQVPNLRTDYSAENSAWQNLGKTLGDLPGDLRKQQLEQQKQQLLGQLAGGNPDFTKVGLGLAALGDTQGGAALIGLGQKVQDRQAERNWLGGSPSTPATPPIAPVSAPTAPTPPGVRVAETEDEVQRLEAEMAGRSQAGNPAQPRGLRNNNPGNIESGRFAATVQGFQGSDGRFARYETPEQGIQAADKLLQSYAGRGLNTVNGIVNRWAPPTENNTGAYVASVARELGVSPDQPLDMSNPEIRQRLISAKIRVENGRQPYGEEVFQRAYAGNSAPVQVAEAAPQTSAPMADVPADGAAAVQGFAVPGGDQAQSILSDKNVQLWQQRLAAAPTERTRAIAQAQLDIAVKDAQQRVAEGKTPEAVREFVWARQNGMTNARTPAEYAREKDKPKGPVTVSEGQRLVDPETGRVIVDAQSGGKTARETEERAAIADRRGLEGEAREAYILNGRVPVGAEKTTEGQANAALYADRMKEAEAVLSRTPISEASASRFQRSLSGVPIYGNNLVSPEFQQADQAKRNFINAALRRESGAVISPAEFENAEKQYFPQPGDSKQVLEQKTRNRATAIQGVSNAAGPSYAKRQKETAPQQFREGQRASNGTQTIVFRNGQWVPE